jgi:hypothetical protein
MRKLVTMVAIGLAVPSVALAAKPPVPGTGPQGKAAPKVIYVLKGAVQAYSNPGTITLKVLSANHYRTTLKNQVLQLKLDATTKLAGTVKSGGNALVKVKAAKTIASADLVPTLQGVVAFEVIGSGKSG